MTVKSTKVFDFYLTWLLNAACMLLIHTSAVTPRLQYIFSLLLREILGLDFAFTLHEEEFLAFQGPRLAYLKMPVGGTFFIESTDLLFENGIQPVMPAAGIHEGLPFLFGTPNPDAALPYDPFAAAFYMVSRYEEYDWQNGDKYGRFPAEESIAFHENFLGIPVVHLWARQLESVMRTHFPLPEPVRTGYRFIPTIDIDHAYAFYGRGMIRTLGGFGRSLLKGDFSDFLLRVKVLKGKASDPYDNYGFIRKIHDERDLHPLYFILCADYGGDDNNISVKDLRFRHLLRELDRDGGAGIHPSLASHKEKCKWESEFQLLSGILGRKTTISRMHFLKISFPETYRELIRWGITDDYSMGYSSHPGFRAGIALPFFFFDLERNETSGLRIHPFPVMDVTLKDYLRLNIHESLETIRQVIQQVRSVNGELVTLWHNESLSGRGRWEGWREVYETMLGWAAC